MCHRPVLCSALVLGTALFLAGITVAVAHAQREHTRLTPRRSTAVSEAQASELTLTLTEVAVRPVQVWVRTAGQIDAARQTVTAAVEGPEGGRVSVGQRVRAFSPETRSRMYQATVSQVVPRNGGVSVKARLQGQVHETSRHYILEILTEGGEFLSVPNEAIIETGGTQMVYIQQPGGGYEPKEITVGLQGELFTHVVEGLSSGQQVVTIGSFFIDAEHKLKGP